MSRVGLIPPYRHPTSVGFVDDNFGFIHSLEDALPSELCCTTFLTPEEALEWVNTPPTQESLLDRCFSTTEDFITLDINALEEEIKDLNRFRRVSVMMIDYAMPTMDGLEFCAAMHDRDIQRVLLTGVADEKTAVEAFNAGLIDRYVPKAKLNTPAGVIPHIRESQERYFQQYADRLHTTKSLPLPDFVTDLRFRQLFDEVVASNQIVEYYLVTKPPGYLMLRSDGTMLRLLLANDDYVATQLETIRRFDPPSSFTQAVENGAVPYFYEHPKDYGQEAFPWDEFVFTTVNRADMPWRVAIVDSPPQDVDFAPEMSSFDVYLSQNASK